MKIISIHKTTKKIIANASNNDRGAQKIIFEQYAPKMLAVCRQYVKDNHHAEDMMNSGFLKVFTNLHKYRNEGSFEGWIRRIMINTCLTYLQKKNKLELIDEEYGFYKETIDSLEGTNVADIQVLIDSLPEGYKIVFNLFAIEGYKHAEIAEKLNISESTSKSQLHKARKWLQTNYIKINRMDYDG